MSDHSTAGSLRDKLRVASEESREEVKALVDEQLRTLAGELSQSVAGARRTIEADIQRLTGDARRWLFRPVLYGILAALGVAIGSAGMSAWLAADIRSKLDERARLAVEIAHQTETLRRIEDGDTWGILFREDEDGQYLILPDGTTTSPGRTVGGQPLVRLSKE